MATCHWDFGRHPRFRQGASTLAEAGMPEKQAEVLARSQATLIGMRRLSHCRGGNTTDLLLQEDLKEMAEAGMPEKQAEVLARSQATLIDEKLATKQDLKELEARLDAT